MNDCCGDGLTLEEAALLYAQAALITERLEDAEIDSRRPASPLPGKVLTCGEAWNLIPLVMVLLEQRYPQLSDPDTLSELLSGEYIRSAGGKPN